MAKRAFYFYFGLFEIILKESEKQFHLFALFCIFGLDASLNSIVITQIAAFQQEHQNRYSTDAINTRIDFPILIISFLIFSH